MLTSLENVKFFAFWRLAKVLQIKKVFGAGGDRTHDLLIRSQTPYPLGHRAMNVYTFPLN